MKLQLTDPEYDRVQQQYDDHLDAEKLRVRSQWFVPACVSGACGGGRQPCPTPQACQVQMWDVEKEMLATANKWVRTVGLRTLGLTAVAAVGLGVLTTMVFAGWVL